MILNKIVVGQYQANCYILGDETTGRGIVIDPGAEFLRIWGEISQLNLTVEKILLTHAHIDHIGAVSEMVKRTKAELFLHPADLSLYSSTSEKLNASFSGQHEQIYQPEALEENMEITCGEIELAVRHTPGHTLGSVCLLGRGTLFTGDTLFHGSIGRTDFPYASLEQILVSIQEKILRLDDQTVIYPGHGPRTNLEWERKYNPFLRKEFLQQHQNQK
ncbi:MAG: MBL fold metallo-hydrolase [candidate division Zixibacteria bacterium]|nr:MBL fold metallo-hydrolase [candidate division Zixibacteria bacterium]